MDRHLGHLVLGIEVSLRTSVTALVRFGVPVRLGIVVVAGAGIRAGGVIGDNTGVVVVFCSMVVLLLGGAIGHRIKSGAENGDKGSGRPQRAKWSSGRKPVTVAA